MSPMSWWKLSLSLLLLTKLMSLLWAPKNMSNTSKNTKLMTFCKWTW